MNDSTVPRGSWLLPSIVLFSTIAFGCSDDGTKLTIDVAPRLSVLCSSDRECTQGRCDPLRGCVDCLFDTDCDPDQTCTERRCTDIPNCKKTSDCAQGVCDLDREECVGCTTDADCADAQRCASSRCVSFSNCHSDAECNEGLHCDTTSADCVGCRTDTDCGAREACKSRECVPRCANNADCPSHLPVCGPNGLCGECLGNSDCPAVYHCAANRCELDICDTGQTCSKSRAAIQKCNQAGDGYDVSLCPASTVCISESRSARCERQICTPGAWGCDTTNRYTELCSVHGDAIASRVDCATSDGQCVDGACAPVVCEPTTRRCSPSGVLVCNQLGTEETLEPCTRTQYCDIQTAECVPIACEPGSLACAAETIAQCSPDGAQLEPTSTDCAATGRACWSGECLPRICHGEFLCVDGKSFACSDNGTRLAPNDTCGVENATYCDTDKGTCASFNCEPAQPVCNGELATSCKDDGSAPRDVGVDCTAVGKTCWNGECLPLACSEPYQCTPTGDLLRCSNHATALVLEKTCGPGTVCDATNGTCRLQKCKPSQPACNGNLATRCDSSGLAFEGEAIDCSATQQACVDGACLPIICDADLTYCEGDELRRCDSTGTASTLVATCGDAEFCRAGESVCLPRVCSPGSAVCAGNFLTTCTPDGSGPEPGGAACAIGTACDLGRCLPIVCAANQRLCANGDVYICNSSGTDFTIYDNCDPREYCEDSGSEPASCQPDVCIASRPACDGETLATCKPDGSGTESPTIDCRTTEQVCDLRGACVSEAVDAIAASSQQSFSEPTAHFVLLHVTTPRRVSRFEVQLHTDTAQTITWIAYRSNAEFGPYTRILQGAGEASESLISTSWAPPNLLLEANSYYLIGLGVGGTHQLGIATGSSSLPLSFGVVIGGYRPLLTGTGPNEIRINASEVNDPNASVLTTSRL